MTKTSRGKDKIKLKKGHTRNIIQIYVGNSSFVFQKRKSNHELPLSVYFKGYKLFTFLSL